jgi:SH3 domain-containing YSC84-like protein 1
VAPQPGPHDRHDLLVSFPAARADRRHGKAFGTAASALHQARAVLVVPRLPKGGFFAGGAGGEGVLIVQARNGTWSNPAFYGIGGASFGLQAGGEQSELILLVMMQKGLDGLLNDHFKIGAQSGITVATLGSGVAAAISGPAPPDIIVWSSSTGLYAGLSIDGSIVHPNHDDDARW